jgi:hypothetical protein
MRASVRASSFLTFSPAGPGGIEAHGLFVRANSDSRSDAVVSCSDASVGSRLAPSDNPLRP